MKKNLMSVLILALVLVNLVLTAILTITILPQTKKSNELINQVCSAINLELQSGEVQDVSQIPVNQLATYSLPNEFMINLKDSGDGKQHVAQLSVSIYMDKDNKDYKTYGTEEKLAEHQTLIENEVNHTVNEYTIEDMTNHQQDVQDEITRRLQKLYNSDFIVGVGFSKITCQ